MFEMQEDSFIFDAQEPSPISNELQHKNTLIAKLSSQPDDAAAHSSLGVCYAREKDYENAEKHLRQACMLAPANPNFMQNAVALMTELGKERQLIRMYESFIGSGSFDQRHYYNYAVFLERENKLENARKIVDMMLQQEPADELTIQINIRMLLRESKYQEALEFFDANKSNPIKRISVISIILYDMVKVCDKQGLVDLAMQYAENANRAAYEMRTSAEGGAKYDKKNYINQVMVMSPAIDDDVAQRLNELSLLEDDVQPVFLFGFPGSGSALAQQIVDGHSQTVVMEEKNFIEEVFFAAMSEKNTAIALLKDSSEEDIARYRAMYWEKVNAEIGALDGRKLVDHNQLHTPRMFFVKMLFPQAKLIFLQRHPFDCCLSAYFKPFKINSAMANFARLNDALSLYALLMHFWQRSVEKLEMDYHYLRYESLTKDVEGQSRALFEFIGLPWQPELLDFHARGADSSSYRWQGYRQYFDPFTPKLQPYLDMFDYSS